MTRWLRRLAGGVRDFVTRRTRDRELEDELVAFVEEAAERKMAAGLSQEEAWMAARRESGSLLLAKDQVRDVMWESRLEDLMRDARLAVRMLRRTPGFTLTAVCTLALGIGANAAVFSLVNGLLLQPVPGVDLSRVVALVRMTSGNASFPTAIPVTERQVIEDAGLPEVAAVFTRDPIVGVLSAAGQVEPVSVEAVSAPYFEAFAVAPAAGRLLNATDDVDVTAGIPAVISERLFRTWFGGDASRAIGARAVVAGQNLHIVGVAPGTFRGTWLPTIMSPDVWVPASVAHRLSTVQGVRSEDQPRHTFVWLAPGASRDQLEAAVATIGGSLPSQRDGVGPLAVIDAQSAILFDAYVGPGLMVGGFFVGLSLLVFLTACANLTNLVLARATSRAGEIAIRLAMGGSRARVGRLLVMEVAVVTVAAGAVALGVAYGLTTLMTMVPIPRLDNIAVRFDPTPDLVVFGYALLVAFVATVVVGVAPAWRVSGVAPMMTLKAGGFGGGTRRGARMRAVMVGAQVAMSTILLVVAGLLMRSSLRASTFDPGFDTSRGAMASVDLRFHRYDEAEGRRIRGSLLEAARSIPGVQQAVLTSGLAPFGPMPFAPAGLRTEGDTSERGLATRRTEVSPGFFRALGLALLSGREFSDADVEGAPLVAVVNQALVDRLGPGQASVGRRVTLGPDTRPIEIVGVVANIPTEPRRPDRIDPVLYLPVAQHYSPRMTVIVLSDRPAVSVEPLRQAVRAVDPDLAVLDAGTFADGVAVVAGVYRAIGLLVTALGAIGFATAVFGLYGVLAFVVSQRTREFGIRRALGATTGAIYGMIVRSGVTMAVAGAVVGVGCALLVGQLIAHLLYGIEPHDPVTLLVVVSVLTTTVTAGSALAARRAARVDPNVALRDL